MKKIAIIASLLLFFSFVGFSFAEELSQTQRTTSTGSLKASASASIIENLRLRANKEITRRIGFLTELSLKLDQVKKLSDTDKTSLKSQIQAQIDSLNALKAKIDADTDITTLRADVKSIINGYYTFAYFRVKISLYVASGRLSSTIDTSNIVYNKLQTRISEEEAKGTDVTALKALLSDMLLKITDAKTQYDSAKALLDTLDVSAFPKNKTSFIEVRAKLKLGAQDLRAAYKDAVKIRQGLGDVRGNLKKGTFEQKESSKSSEIN